MSASFWFDRSRVLDAVRAGLEDGLDEAANRIAANARQRAPIRKVFREKRGFRFKVRELTRQEKKIALRLASEYYGVSARTYLKGMDRKKYWKVQRLSTKSANAPGNSRAKRQLGHYVNRSRFVPANGAKEVWTRSGVHYEPGEAIRAQLTTRGLEEVRSGAAIHRDALGNVQIGGALKASIGVGEVRETAGGITVEVVAAIRYAKYVEFPTVHNRAQPFLLPALKDEQRTLTATVADSIRKQLGGG